MFAQGQGNTWIFHRYRKSVENSCGHTFTLRHLAQIKYIYPDSYSFKSTKLLHQGRHIDSIEITPIEPSDKPDATTSHFGTVFKQANFAGELIERRRRAFRENLIDYVDKYHTELLTKSHTVVRTWRDIKQWHPDFALNTDVPDLPQAELPNVNTGIARPDKDRIRWLLGQTTSPQKGGSDESPETYDGSTLPKSAASDTDASVIAVAKRKEAPVTKVSALLERIRAKEQKRKEGEMMGVGPEKMAERAMLSRLPGMADSISYLFYSQRKSVLPLSLLCEKLSQSAQVSLSSDECEAHVTKISDLVPNWCRVETLAHTKMVRIIRVESVRQVKQQLEEKLKSF